MPRRVYDSPAWKYARRRVLGESAASSPTGRPVCAECQGEATAVDHIVSLQEAPGLAFTISNLRPICRRCNSSKAAKRRAELARRAVDGGLAGGPTVYGTRREW